MFHKNLKKTRHCVIQICNTRKLKIPLNKTLETTKRGKNEQSENTTQKTKTMSRTDTVCTGFF